MRRVRGRQVPLPFGSTVTAVLDPVRAVVVTDRAVAVADVHAPPGYVDTLVATIHTLAQSHERLTSDDVWVALGSSVMQEGNASALGCAFRMAAHRGWIRLAHDERAESQRPATHRRPLRVWYSTLWPAAPADTWMP